MSDSLKLSDRQLHALLGLLDREEANLKSIKKMSGKPYPLGTLRVSALNKALQICEAYEQQKGTES